MRFPLCSEHFESLKVALSAEIFTLPVAALDWTAHDASRAQKGKMPDYLRRGRGPGLRTNIEPRKRQPRRVSTCRLMSLRHWASAPFDAQPAEIGRSSRGHEAWGTPATQREPDWARYLASNQFNAPPHQIQRESEPKTSSAVRLRLSDPLWSFPIIRSRTKRKRPPGTGSIEKL